MKTKADEVKRQFADVINRNSLENDSGTPDFILAEYLYECLEAFNKLNRTRAVWKGEPAAVWETKS